MCWSVWISVWKSFTAIYKKIKCLWVETIKWCKKKSSACEWHDSPCHYSVKIKKKIKCLWVEKNQVPVGGMTQLFSSLCYNSRLPKKSDAKKKSSACEWLGLPLQCKKQKKKSAYEWKKIKCLWVAKKSSACEWKKIKCLWMAWFSCLVMTQDFIRWANDYK